MDKSELRDYLAREMPDALEAHIEASYYALGTFDALCTLYKEGHVVREDIECRWQRRGDALTYSIGMLRTRQADAGILNALEDN